LNKSDKQQTVRLKITGVKNQKFYIYRVTEQEVSKPSFRMDPVKEIVTKEGETVILDLPGKSISTLTSFKSLHNDPARKE
jgi:hypothetical protein